MSDNVFAKTAVPFDGSNVTDEALGTITALTSGAGGEIHFVMVLDQFVRNELAAAAASEASDVERLARNRVGAMEARLKEEGVAASSTIIDSGGALEGILGTVRDEGCTSIAVATHGFKGITRWLMGNLVDKIIQGATVPVLIIPPRRR